MREAGKPLSNATQAVETLLEARDLDKYLEIDDIRCLEEAYRELDKIHAAYAEVMSRLYYVGHIFYSVRTDKYGEKKS